MNKTVIAARKLFGTGFAGELSKSEVYKTDSRIAVSMDEVRIAMDLVPRAILLWLIKNLKGLKKGESKELKIPMVPKGVMNVTKHGPDDYSGDLVQDGDKEYDFEHRSLPGIGLVVLSTFELYEEPEEPAEEDRREWADPDRLSRYVEEKLEASRLVDEVRESKKELREAQEELLRLKLANRLREADAPKEDKKEDKRADLARFIKEHKKDLVELALEADSTVRCPHCDSTLLEKREFRGCCCLGEDMDSGLELVKSEAGVSLVRFSKGWEPENKERLIKILNRRR
jgi:hypothetical protein